MRRALRFVFDLDDTLYPERSFAIGGFEAAGAWAFGRWGVEGVAGHMRHMLDTGHLGGLFRATLERYVPGCTDDDVAAFIDVYRRHDPDIALYDDARHALEFCSGFGPMGLITDGTDWVQRRKVDALAIDGRFQEIVYTFSLGGREFHKPNPRSFEIVQSSLRGDGERLVYVGDNPAKDFVAPNALGWSTVQVLREQTIHDTGGPPAPGGAPQHVVDSLEALEALVPDLL